MLGVSKSIILAFSLLATSASAGSYGPYADNTYLEYGDPSSVDAAVIVHGGYDRSGSNAQPFFETLSQFLGKRGIYVISINYRLTPDGNPWPAQWQDVQTAIRYLRSLGYARVTAIGASAGGYDVAGAAFQTGVMVNKNTDPMGESALYPGFSSQADAYVMISPFTDLTDVALDQDSISLLTSGMSAKGGMSPPIALAKASPITYIHSDTPPILLFTGTIDKVVPDAQSIRFTRQMAYQHAPFRHILYAGGHVFASVPAAMRITYFRQMVSCARNGPDSFCHRGTSSP